jgi:excisionase family DNA binding protein
MISTWLLIPVGVDVNHQEEFLTVRETARRLGVHENTVRNWVRDGILPTARVPGSRFHRFDARDVERLRQQRGATVSSIEQERRTIGPELVDGTQLSQWATTRDIQGRFPELVRRLLASTPGITEVSVRAGEGVSAPGWDGRAKSVGTAYLPSGSLCFEFGVGSQPKAKADEDYKKRRDNPQGVVPADTTFVFVTPRRWSGAAAWADARRAEGVFADVRVLDADDLEGWLQATPAVHHWISELLGRRPRAAETLERWWARFQAQTDPALPLALFLVGRDHQREQLTEFLVGYPSVITVQAVWRDEAIAFVSATIEVMERDSRPVKPPLIVSSAEVWDRVMSQPGRMTLLPLFERPDIATAQQGNHHVILPIGREQVARGATIDLPPPNRQGAIEALEAAGVDSNRAYELAALARRSMPSLIRTLARDPRITRPPWSQLPAAAVLAPLVLAGAWTASEVDTNLVSRMADEQWPVIERTLQHWRSTDDPPFVRSGTQWHLASPEEAFLVLRDALTPSDLQRWRQVAPEVLLETDPSLELPREERLVAAAKGIARGHSSVLRRGLAEGIALVGSMGADTLSDGVSGADHARRLVHDILDQAGGDVSGQVWRSLADILPLLAEAAPEVFLDAVHDDLDRHEPLLATLFQDTDQDSWLDSSSPHTGLLWALETLCWSPEFLLDASRALAHLHVIDPGGRLSNRPLESLQSVLVGWIRQTAAPLDLRVRAIEQICRQLPDIGWRLILKLWPSHHALLLPPATPRFHDWRPESPSVLISEWIEYIGYLVGLAIDLAGADPVRWAELSEHLGPLPPAERSRLLQALGSFADPDSLNSQQRLLLWERLHKEVAEHRRFSTAAWSMDEESLSVMQAIADRLEPTTNVERFGYLFDWQPDLPDVGTDNYAAYEARLVELRTHAVRNTLDVASIEGLRNLAERSPVPSHLGWIVGAVAPEGLTPALLTWLDSEKSKLRDVAVSWASRSLVDKGIGWLFDVLARPEVASPARRNAIARCVPSTIEFWDALAQIDTELLNTYWNEMHPWRLRPQDADRAARELVRHGRAWAAVDLLASIMHQPDGPSSVTPALVEEVFDAALTSDPTVEGRVQVRGYEIGVLLDYLEAKRTDLERLARYEFVFFRLLEHHRQPRALSAALGRNPTVFVELVSRVYRGKNQPRRQLGQQEEALARQAWWILHHWHELPGQREDGTMDGEHLEQWVRDARLALADVDRADIGDEQIGRVLATSPTGTDGIWPAEPVRNILETIGSVSMETGVHVGVINQRGVTTRGVYEGGQQERTLAARYRQWAKQTAGNWPRTSRVLRGLAESYEREAQREDARAEVTADTE